MTTKVTGVPGAKWAGRSLIAAILLAGYMPAQAQQTPAQQAGAPASYNLPAQSLGSAIVALASQARVEIIAPTALVEGRSAPALRGRFTPDEALQHLLQGSGLVVTRVGAAFVIKAGNAEAAEPPPPGDAAAAA